MELQYLAVIEIEDTFARIAFSKDTLRIRGGNTNIDPFECKTKLWSNGSSKTPINMLIQSDGKSIHSFGHEAEINYNDLLENGTHTSYFFMREITQIIDSQTTNLDVTVTVKDEQGKPLLAIDAIVILLEYLVSQVKENASKLCWLKSANPYLVLSLPSRSPNFFQFVEQALVKIGITSSFIVSSSTANASFFTHLQTLWTHSILTEGNTAIPPLTQGLKILTVFFEEKFTELSVHESSLIDEDSKVLWSENYENKTDTKFYDMLVNIFGKKIDDMQSSDPEEWSELLENLQIKKRNFDPLQTDICWMRLPLSLQDPHNSYNPDDAGNDGENPNQNNNIRIYKGRLGIPSNMFVDLFKDSKSKVLSLVKNAVEKHKIEVLFLIGANSKVPLYREAIVSICNDLKVQLVIPKFSDTVVHGSIIAGLRNLAAEEKRQNVMSMTFDETTATLGFSNKPKWTKMKSCSYDLVNVPTSVLLLSDGKTLDLFGKEAEDEYKRRTAKGLSKPFYFVRGIKKLLDAGEKLDELMDIEDENGKPLSAFNVLVLMIRRLSENVMERCIDLDDSRWVITLPSRSNPRCVDLFRKAAIEAGITGRLMVISVKDAIVLHFCNENVDKLLPPRKYMSIASVYLQETFLEVNIHEINNGQLSTLKECSELHRAEFGDIRNLEIQKKKVLLSSLRTASKETNFDVIFLVGECKNLSDLHRAIVQEFKDSKKVVVSSEKSMSVVTQGTFIAGHFDISVQSINYDSPAILVGSIDFGTTYSGWAASFEHAPNKHIVKLWNSSSVLTEKTPTVALIQPDGHTLEAFGYEAEEKYHQLIENDEHGKYFYFINFKMQLHKRIGEGLNRNFEIQDVTGKKLPAINVIVASIRFMKESLTETVYEEIYGIIKYHEIHWVLTVPAIWTDAAKQFMKEAAIKAGIPMKRLTLALEPEAASIYCRNLPVEVNTTSSEKSISKLSLGTKYMIVDAGGGTVDITVHEVIEDQCVREIFAASGGGWGGNTVNAAFERYIERLFGEKKYAKFRKEHVDDRLHLIKDFEIKKRGISPSSGKSLQIRLCRNLVDSFGKSKQKLSEHIKKSGYSSDLNLRSDKLTLSDSIVQSFFKESIDQIIRHIQSILCECPVSVILMVGGFSDSPMLKHAIVNSFPKISLVKPDEAIYAIVKGAALFGHNPRQITERVLKYTYGIGTCDEFDDSKHPASKRYNTDAGVLCRDVFGKHVERNQRVKVGEAQVEQTYTPVFKSQKRMSFDVYASESCNPRFTDDDCKLVGKLSVDLLNHDGNLDREVLVSLTFSGTEITIQAKDIKEGRLTSASIDFLG